MVTKPQPFELLNVRLLADLSYLFSNFWAFSINGDELAFYIMLASKYSCKIEGRQEMKNGAHVYMRSW
jgi:hypothetical protein